MLPCRYASEGGGEMKATLTFSLPDDEEVFDIHFNAPRRARQMVTLHEEMKSIAKHGIKSRFETVEELADYIYRDITWEYVH